MIDDRNEYERTKAWLKPIKSQVIIGYLMTIDMPLLPLATLILFTEFISEGKEYQYCNGELHIVYDEKENEIWRIN